MKCLALEQAAEAINQLAIMAGRLGFEDVHGWLTARYLGIHIESLDAGCEWAQPDLPDNSTETGGN